MQYKYDGVGLGVRCGNNLSELSYPLHVVIWRLQHFLRRRVKFVPFFNQELFPRTSISSTPILPSVGRTSIFVSLHRQPCYPVALELAELMVAALLRHLLQGRRCDSAILAVRRRSHSLPSGGGWPFSTFDSSHRRISTNDR